MIAKIIKLIRTVQLALALWWFRLKVQLSRSVKRNFGINLKLLGIPSVIKVPKHLGIHIELDPVHESYEIEETVKTIAKLILWGFDTGTEFITIFEPSDFLSDPANLMLMMKYLKTEYCESCSVGLFQQLKHVAQIYTNDSIIVQLKNDSNTQSSKNVKLRILSKKDGHDDLSRLIKDIANDDSYPVKDINDEIIAKGLSSNIKGIPMDCILGISRYDTVTSFPPWLLRNAELL